MTATALLDTLEDAGLELVLSGGRLRYRPQTAATPALVARMRAQRTALLALPWCRACGRRLRLPETAATGVCLACMDTEAFTTAAQALKARHYGTAGEQLELRDEVMG